MSAPTEWRVAPAGAVHFGLFFGETMIAKATKRAGNYDALAEIAAEANSYPRLARERDELVAALVAIAKETGPASDGPGTIATIGRIARAALAQVQA